MPLSYQDDELGCGGWLAAHWLGTGYFILLLWAGSNGDVSLAWLALWLLIGPIVGPMLALVALCVPGDGYILGDISSLGFVLLLLWPFLDFLCYVAIDRLRESKRGLAHTLLVIGAAILAVVWFLN